MVLFFALGEKGRKVLEKTHFSGATGQQSDWSLFAAVDRLWLSGWAVIRALYRGL